MSFPETVKGESAWVIRDDVSPTVAGNHILSLQSYDASLWSFAPGERCFVVRGGGSLLAFEAGSIAPALAGFRVVGAHTDSPNLRIKPSPDVSAQGYRQLAVEPYGGVLLHTWLDRDLSLAGRVTLRSDSGVTPRRRRPESVGIRGSSHPDT